MAHWSASRCRWPGPRKRPLSRALHFCASCGRSLWTLCRRVIKGEAMSSLWLASASFVASLAALGLASALLVFSRQSVVNRALGMLLGVIAVIHVANGLGLLHEERELFYRRLALLGELAQPAG